MRSAKMKKWLTPKQQHTRRAALTMLLGLAAIAGDLLLIRRVQARAMHGGTAAAVSSSLISTMSLLNTSGTTQQIGQCTQIFGHPFKKGDITTGTMPIFKTNPGGTVIPYSCSAQKTVWSDGSLKHCSFMLRLPVTIAGSGTLNIDIYGGGTAPSASSRALSDFAAGGLDLNLFVTGQDNLIGDWTSNLNQGVSAANTDNYKFMDGDAGAVWRVRASARQSAADHGQLEGYWYVQAMNDSSAALGGIRYLPCLAQPWTDVPTPACDYRSFTAIKTRNGVTQIKDVIASQYPAPFTFTATGGNVILGTANTATFQTGVACKFSNSGGALPTNFNSTTLYCPRIYSPTEFYVGTNFTGVVGANDTLVTPASNGTGTQTCTFYPMIAAFGKLFFAEDDGRYSYIQGAGSFAADSTLLCRFDMTYWCRTTLLQPFALGTYTVADNPTYTFAPWSAGPVYRNLSGTGERDDIGLMCSWQARDVMSQTAVNERAVRIISFVGGTLSACMKTKANLSCLVANNTNYTGMPAGNLNLRWDTNPAHTNGFTNPAHTDVMTQGWSGLDYSHMVSYHPYAWMKLGEPQICDMLVDWGSASQTCGYPGTVTAVVDGSFNTIGGIRNATINGTTRYGQFFGENLLRLPAWLFRSILATQLLPNQIPGEKLAAQTYFRKLISDTFTGCLDYIAMLTASANSFVTTNGMWSEQDNGSGSNGAMWCRSYYMSVMSFGYAVTESTDALTFNNYLWKWPAYVCNTFGGWSTLYYQATERLGPASNSLYITDGAHFAADVNLSGNDFHFSWDSGTNLCTVTDVMAPLGGWTTANFAKCVLNSVINTIPGGVGFAAFTPLYVVNKTGSGIGMTFQLSLTVGGPPLTLTDSGSTNGPAMQTLNPIINNDSAGSIVGAGYGATLVAAANYHKALGGTIDATMKTTMTTMLTNQSDYVTAFQADPKNATTLNGAYV